MNRTLPIIRRFAAPSPRKRGEGPSPAGSVSSAAKRGEGPSSAGNVPSAPRPAKRGEGGPERREGPAQKLSPRTFALTCAFFAGSLFGQSVIMNNPGKKPAFAIRNATIYPVTAAPIANGTIVFDKGVITAVGANATIPAGATVIDGTGLSVYPGLIDSGSQ